LGRVDGRARRLAADAGARLGAAGIASWKRGEAPATVNLLGRATELLRERDAFRLELLCEVGPALRTGGELARAEATLAGAVQIAAAAADRRLELRARLELSGVQLVSHPGRTADELLGIAAQGIPVFEAVGDDRAMGRAWRWIAHAHGAIRGRHAASAEAADRAIEHLRRSGWPVAACLGDLAVALHAGPTPVSDAVRRCRKLLENADLAGEARIVPLLAGLLAMRGDFSQARELAARGRTLLEQLGQASVAADVNGAITARIELLAGNVPEAESALRASCEALEGLGDRASLATRAAELGDVLCLQRLHDEAGTWCRLAEELGAPDDVPTQFLLRSVQARLLARRGEADDAETLAREAFRITSETDGLNNQAKALIDLSEVLQLAGRSEEAATTVQQAVETFEGKGNTVAAKRAIALLADLQVA
jgi:tetratricopeptide (TPR) repeat protein